MRVTDWLFIAVEKNGIRSTHLIGYHARDRKYILSSNIKKTAPCEVLTEDEDYELVGPSRLQLDYKQVKLIRTWCWLNMCDTGWMIFDEYHV